jgi:hypothetical protein
MLDDIRDFENLLEIFKKNSSLKLSSSSFLAAQPSY